MRYTTLLCADQRANNWVLYRDDGPVVLRERFADLQCPLCKKVDELRAVARGFDDGIPIRASTEVVGTCDGFVCVRAPLAKKLKKSEVFGVEFLSLPGNPAYRVMWPNPLIVTNQEHSGLKFLQTCTACGRPRETLGFVSSQAMELPTQSPAVLGPAIWRESSRGRVASFVADSLAVDMLRSWKVTGLDWSLADLITKEPAPASPIDLQGLDALPRVGAPSDAREIQGRWKLVAMCSNGKPVRYQGIGEVVAFEGDLLYAPATPRGRALQVAVNPRATPPQLDVGLQNFLPRLGIYRLEGDVLVIASANPGSPRPIGFATAGGDANVKIYQRCSGVKGRG